MKQRNFIKNLVSFLGIFLFVASFFSLGCDSVHADPLSQAYTLHQRIAGVPPTATMRTQMANLIAMGQSSQAAALATDSPYFYNVTLKNWAKPMTNKDQLVLVDFNDMVATIVGMVRDNVPFDQVLYGDILYTAPDGMAGIPAFSVTNNNHYTEIEKQNLDLKAVLTQKVQSSTNGIMDTAGIMTSRGFGSAFLTAGTNRAVVRYAFMNFLCLDMPQVSDVTTPDYHVRMDVDRVPGNDSRTYKTQCVGCHAGLDALSGAASFFDFTGNQVRETPGAVVGKINDGSKVKFTQAQGGWRTVDNSWVNLWATGQNSRLEWTGAQAGNGMRSFGQMLSDTGEFNRCMVKRVFKQVCLREAITDTNASNTEAALVQSLADGFKNSNYNMKMLFANTATHCMGL